MILYKYVSFEAGLKIIESNSIGFSNLEDFNDPFECSGFGFYDLDVPITVAIDAFRNRFSRNYAVLSLTRSALNPLMWAHYGDGHKGIVIGIDTNKSGFEDSDKFIIPSTKGELIYLKTLPKKVLKITIDDLMSVGYLDKLSWESHQSLLKHALLYKMQDWAYEEEVRIVKNIRSSNFNYHFSSINEAILDGQQWKRIQLDTRPIYTLNLPKESIVDVYLGANAYLDLRRKQEKTKAIIDHKVDRLERLKELCRKNSINLHNVIVNKSEWVLRSKM